MRSKLKQIKTFLNKYERILLPFSMMLGIVVDFFTLNRADQVFDNIILLSHLLIVAMGIIGLFIIRERNNHSNFKANTNYNSKSNFNAVFLNKTKFLNKIKVFIPYLMQYSFGGLFSGMIILYAKSGEIITSLPFFITLLVLLVSNEFIHKKYPWLTLQISIFFVALISYTTMVTPILFHDISTLIFILGTLFAVIIISLYLMLLQKIMTDAFKKYRDNILKSLSIIFITFNILYFTNVIPPIPLAIKDGGIFHNVQKLSSGEYKVLGERHEWYKPSKDYNSTFHYKSGAPVFAFASIFAPTKITETIYHKWYFFDSSNSRWIKITEVPITISGGRDDGYRGYSQKSNITKGLWRVDVTNTKGQIIGRLKFNAVPATEKIDLVEKFY